jgi:hypothetical protein
VPIISAFAGIVIRMYYQEHEPAHFHAEHQGQRAAFLISGAPHVGEIRSAAVNRMIRRWAQEHGGELRANWDRMKAGQPLLPIAPLE